MHRAPYKPQNKLSNFKTVFSLQKKCEKKKCEKPKHQNFRIDLCKKVKYSFVFFFDRI